MAMVYKMDLKAVIYIFLGYLRIRKGYKCYSPRLRKKFRSPDVTFHEFTLLYSIKGKEFQENPFRDIVDVLMPMTVFPKVGQLPEKKNQEVENV